MTDKPMRFCVLTVSDRCSRGEAEDTSGPALVDLVKGTLHGEVVGHYCVPDEREVISERLVQWAYVRPRPDVILTTGGTGLAPRDVTPEATRRVIEREHPGLMELARLRCMEKTPKVFLSRGIAGTLGTTLIINLPGSLRGATETLEALLDVLPHAIETLRGDVVDDGRGAVVRRSSLERPESVTAPGAAAESNRAFRPAVTIVHKSAPMRAMPAPGVPAPGV